MEKTNSTPACCTAGVQILSPEQMNRLLEEDYDNWHDINRKRNEYFLNLFVQDMKKAGLKPKTIRSHLNNTDCFLDLLGSQYGYCMEQCAQNVNEYLDDLYIRKCMWSTPSNMKSTAASIKKFLKSMAEHSLIAPEVFKAVCAEIKENMDRWIEHCACWNDSDGFEEEGSMLVFF